MTRDTDPLDQATSKRLSQLRTTPVDTSSLERKLAGVARAGDVKDQYRFTYRRVLRGATAMAAVIAIVVTVALTILTDPSTAVATPIELTRLHNDIVSGEVEMVVADSTEAANLQIASQMLNGPALPGFENHEVQSCCLANMRGDLRAVALLTVDGQPVTLVVAKGSDFAHAMGQPITIDDRTFTTHEMNGIQMVMKNKGDLWLCVMGHLPAEPLARVAAEIEM
jgi:hypothetical protein